MSILDLFWVFFIVSSLLPAIQKRMLQAARLRLMRELEKQRLTNSRSEMPNPQFTIRSLQSAISYL